MATSQLSEVLRHLRRAGLRDEEGQTDGQLLERFVRRREPVAIEVLVRRHGPMVWAVCRRALPDLQDAEDAFQATFLVLVRKAASVVPRERVGNWLYGVAYQTAWKARILAAKRRTREHQVTQLPEPAAVEHDRWEEWRSLLHVELGRLPAKYRMAIVLCDLEGKTRGEAAQQLGVPEGTLSGRLTRGRSLLAKRLTRHGFAVSAGSLAMILSQNAAPACVPAPLVSATVQAAADYAAGSATAVAPQVVSLTEGVLQTMLWTKLKVVAALLFLAAVVGLGVSGSAYPTRAAQDEPRQETIRRVRLKWEYRAISRSEIMKLAPRNSKSQLTDGLNHLGDEGWELVGIESGATVVENPFTSTATGGSTGTGSSSSGGTASNTISGTIRGGSVPSTYLFKRPR
jgi:RNA polymerase sigma factor (sigma-70 family)